MTYIKGEQSKMCKRIIEEKDFRKYELYTELREKFDEYHVALVFRPNAAPEWWAPCVDDEEAFQDAQDVFASELAEIIVGYVETDDELNFERAHSLVKCELNNIRDYADRLQDRMYDLELANYARDKFINDLIDAVINEFGEI